MSVEKDQGGLAEITGVYEGKQARFARPGDKLPEMQGIDKSERWVLKERYTSWWVAVLWGGLAVLLLMNASGVVVVEPTATPPPVRSAPASPPTRPLHARPFGPPITYRIPRRRVRFPAAAPPPGRVRSRCHAAGEGSLPHGHRCVVSRAIPRS